MADIFISYAHSTAIQAQKVVAALRQLGYSVWIDDDLPAHRNYSRVLEEQLDQAKAVLVLWSAEAASSDWVMDEAERAREQHKLVQVTFDRTRLPMPFGRVQCADLTGWSSDLEAAGWRKVLASIADLMGPARPPSPRAPSHYTTVAEPPEPLLAVLAFDNLSGDPEMAYFSDGISEEIQQTVAHGADLKVIGRASSFHFRGAEKAAAKVAGALKATHILDGSVRRSGQRVRISAQLVECRGETTLWSERFDRDLTDIFALQDEIATSIAAALKTAFARSRPPEPIDPAVFDLFLQAQAFDRHGSEEAIRQLRMLEEVVARAPAFARAWARMASLIAFTLRSNRTEAVAAGLTREKAVEAAETALRLDPHMGLAHEALGSLEPYADYCAREAANAKALAAAPNDSEVLTVVGYHSTTVGRLREGLAIGRRAYALDPLAPRVMQQLGLQLSTAGRIEEAVRLYDTARARWPESEIFAGNLIINAARRGDRAKVEDLIRAWSGATARNALQEIIWFARNLLDPDPASIRRWLEQQQAELARTGTVPLDVPWWLHSLGQTEAAFELIDMASFAFVFEREGLGPSGQNFPGLIFNRTNEAFFRDPRFVGLCAKLGLCDYWLATGMWPDCADEVPYDFRAESARLAGAKA